MKTTFLVLGLAGLLTACDNTGISTENKLDSFGNKIEKKFEQVADSVEEKGERLKNKIEDKLDNDSNDRKTDTLKNTQ